MKTLVFALLLACAVPFAASAQSPSGDQMRPDERMVQAVQYPYDWKVKFDPLFSTGRAKDVSGTAEVKRKKEIEVEVKIDAPPPSTLKPGYQTYIVWAVAPGPKFTRLGAIERKGTLRVTTKVPQFGIVVSAEPNANSAAPTDAILESGMPDAKRRIYPIRRVFYKPTATP